MSHETCHTPDGVVWTVSVDDEGAEATRTFYDAAGDVVAVAIVGDFGETCPTVRWWGRSLENCIVTEVDAPVCDTDGDTDTGGDTDTDVPPATCFLTPITSAPPCTAGTCPAFDDLAPCDLPHLGDVEHGRCDLPGRGAFDVTTWVTPDGTVVTAYGASGGPILAWSEDPAAAGCRRWWGPDLTGCEVVPHTVLSPVDCTVDTDGPGDTDTTDETGLLLDTAGGWPIAWTEPGDLVVTELQLKPGGCADPLGELIELKNVGPHPIDLAGLVVDDGIATARLGTSFRLARGAYAVAMPFHAGLGCQAEALVPDVTWVRGPEVHEDGGLLRLLRYDGTALDEVDYTTWRLDLDGDRVTLTGHTLQLLADHESALANDALAAWCQGADLFPDTDPADGLVPHDNWGSPGAVTSTCLP